MAMNAESERKGLNLRFLQLSRPNGNFHDALAQYLTFRALVGTPDAILVAVTYDDLREPGIQFKSFEGLPPLSIDLIKNGGPGISHIVAEMTAQQNTGSSSSAAQNKHISKTKLPHEILEDFIVAKMERLFNSFKLRGKVSAYFEWKTQDLVSRFTRNTSYKRSPDIPEHYKTWNLAALDSLFKVTRLHQTKLLFYKAPHPQGLPLFYHDRNDYDNFHNQLALRCKNEKVPYIDLEPIVPMQYWGLANGGLPDTFHFKGEGHELLATALLDFIKGHAHAF